MKNKAETKRTAKQPKPQNEAFLQVSLHPRVIAWMRDLAAIGLWGQTPEEVASSFIQEKIVREMRGDGFLRTPPPGSF